MKSPRDQLWQIIRAREQSLAATKEFYDDWIRQEQARRTKAETELKQLGEALAQADRQVAAERAARQQEVGAKDQARESLQAELDAHRRWEKLCREAEQQVAALRKQLAAEARAHAAAQSLLCQTEAQIAAVDAARMREAAAKDKTQQALKTEVEAHGSARNLLAETEQHLAAERANRQQEMAAKEKNRQALQAEADAHRHWEKLCHEAEAQLAAFRQQLSAETGAHAASRKLLAQAESQVTAERVTREQEMVAKEKSRLALQAEADAHRHWEKLCHEAEQQLAAIRQQLDTETRAHAASKQLLAEAEGQVAAERLTREQEMVAKEKTRLALQAEADAHRHWEKLCHEAEAQLAAFRLQLATETEAHAAARQLLVEAERYVAVERATREEEAAAKEQTRQALEAEVAAHRHWEKLCHEAEQQLAPLREQLSTEASAHAAARKLVAQIEEQISAERALVQQESKARQKDQAALKDESAARQRWEKLCQEGETQLATLRQQLAAETVARAAADKLLAQAEGQFAAERASRQQESAAREKALVALKAEGEARQRWEKLCHDTEHQRAALRQQLETEAVSHQATRKSLAQAEQKVASLDAARGHEMAAKAEALQSLAAELEAHQRWQQLCREAEAQRDTNAAAAAEAERLLEGSRASLQQTQDELRVESATHLHLQGEYARASARLSELTTRAARVAFTRHLENEQHRFDRQRHTYFGAWLAFRNTGMRILRRVYCALRRKPVAPARALPGPRIVQVNTHDLVGGAERTSYDLHLQYRARGLAPTLIVAGKHSQDADVFPIPFRIYDWKYAHIWRDRWGLTEVLYLTPLLGCFKWPQLRQSHVVHIHNMHGHSWNSATLLPLGLQHPVVLTLHDEYTMTGDCCYTHDCDRWTRSCGKCPQIPLPREARYTLGERDLTRLNVHIKRFIFRAPRAYPLVLVTPSNWLAERARRSPNLRHLPIISINNGVDLDLWHPLPQAQARAALGLPADKTIGLLVAHNLSDPRKGYDVALESIRKLPANTNLLFVVVGKISEEAKADLAGLPVIASGYVSEKFKMLNLFSAADFTFSLSRADNLPYMCVESLACGRPVFGSAVGGIPEIVNDPLLGWLTPMPFDSQAIAHQLVRIDQESPEIRAERFAACRRSAEARFSLQLMVARYLALYEEARLAAQDGRRVDVRNLAHVASISP